MAAYVIAALPRTGSFMLSDMLSVSAVAGHPDEYGGSSNNAHWRDFAGFVAHREYFDDYLRRSRTINGVFGAKLMWPQFVDWTNDARGYLRLETDNRHAIVEALIGPHRYVALSRRDRVRQAVSLVLATRTGRWSTAAPSGGRVEDVPYDRTAVDTAVRRIEDQTAAWRAHFAEAGVRPLEIFYEDLAAAPVDCAASVLRWLGIVVPHRLGLPRLHRQSSTVNDRWVEAYRRGD